MTPEAFEADWVDRLASGALVLFKSGEPATDAFVHAAVADAFIEGLGLTPIGFNWELLDAGAHAGEPRSAIEEITKALSHDIANPSTSWLDVTMAQECASDFLSLFDHASCTIVSNRYDGLWNPISGGAFEWGFVGFDAKRIVLLLLVAK